jgi:hypothetical protein
MLISTAAAKNSPRTWRRVGGNGNGRYGRVRGRDEGTGAASAEHVTAEAGTGKESHRVADRAVE